VIPDRVPTPGNDEGRHQLGLREREPDALPTTRIPKDIRDALIAVTNGWDVLETAARSGDPAGVRMAMLARELIHERMENVAEQAMRRHVRSRWSIPLHRVNRRLY
jgi:hypothetical protein